MDDMKFYKDIEKVIEYIENHIMDVDMDEIGHLVGMPIGLFQRIFTYICGLSITEYIKKRKISLAAEDLMAGRSKIIELAMTYGYESHSAFSRAFKDQMGLSPSECRKKGREVNLYPKFSFQVTNDTYYVVKGRRIMADLIRMEYEFQDAKKLIGYQERTDFKHAGGMWQTYFEEGHAQKINSIEPSPCNLGMDYISLGYMRDFDEAGMAFEYTIGKYFPPGTESPAGFVGIEIPSGMVAHGKIQGTLNDVLNDAYFLLTEAIQKNGYRIDYDNFYWSDVYTLEGYCKPMEMGDEIIVLDYYLPVIKANS
jgi:AraC family transcriptional regulator